jgi:hypothetical protein
MDDLLERLAAGLGVGAPTAGEQQLLLDCARDVAHGSERRHAPLSTFLLGVAVGAGDVDRETALREAVERVRAVIAADRNRPGPGAG